MPRRMLHPPAGTALALAIFFSSFLLLKDTLCSLEPWVRPVLARALGAPVRGVLAGFLVTLVIQSSSATSAIAVGLVAARLLRLSDALAIVLGANVGTTLTGQLAAFSLGEAGLGFIALGLLLFGLRRPAARLAGALSLGLGGLFYGLWALGRSLSALSGAPALSGWLDALWRSDLHAVALGAGVTAIVQSSSAVTSLLVGLADAGLIPVRSAVGAALGSNVGTVVTTILVSLAAGGPSRRVALCDLVFNALGVLFVFPFLSHVPAWMAALAAAPGRQVAHAHTLFNVITVLLALPFVKRVGRWLENKG